MSQELQKTDGLQGYVFFDEYEAIREVMADNLGGERLSLSSLDRIKMPAGGALSWEVNTIGGAESVSTLSGVIVHEHKTRTYWQESFETSGGDTPPDCFSEDLMTGQGNPGGECADCPFSQFGANSERPECREGRVLFLLCKDSALPVAVSLPPSSLRAYTEYKVRLSRALIRISDIETHFTLEREKNKKGIPYSRAVFKAGAKASGEQKAMLQEQSATVKGLLSSTPARTALPAGQNDGHAGTTNVSSDIGV